MNSIAFSAMRAELEKIAATVDQLGAGFKRLGVVRVPSTAGDAANLMLQGGGAVTSFPPARLQKLAPQVAAAWHNGFDSLHGAGSDLAKRGRSFIDQALSISPEASAAAGSLHNKHPLVAIAKNGLSAKIPEAMGHAPISNEAKRPLAYFQGHHEGFERGVKPREEAYGFGHRSPTVLMNESNMINRATGPGAEEAAGVVRHIRNVSGDGAALQAGMVKQYGPRATQFLEPGNKVPKAMRKHFAQQAHVGNVTEFTQMPKPMIESITPYLPPSTIAGST